MSESSVHLAIILPVYNTEKYLSSCLDSLKNQSNQNFTVYAIDDGSTDGSGALLDELSGDPRFVIVHKTNGGVSDARNKGLELAKASPRNTFISFIDSDDILSEKYVEICLKHMSNDANVDYAVFAYQMFDKKGLIHNKHIPLVTQRLNQDQIAEHYFRIPEPSHKAQDLTLGRFLCNKVFRTATLQMISFNTNMTCGEDQDFFIRLIPHLKNGILIPDILYYYRLRKSSLSHSLINTEPNMELFERLYFGDFPMCLSARKGIELSLLDSWWQETKRVYENGANPSDRKKVRETFRRLQDTTLLNPLSKKFKKRFKLMRLGDWFLMLYFTMRVNKNNELTKYYYFD